MSWTELGVILQHDISVRCCCVIFDSNHYTSFDRVPTNLMMMNRLVLNTVARADQIVGATVIGYRLVSISFVFVVGVHLFHTTVRVRFI